MNIPLRDSVFSPANLETARAFAGDVLAGLAMTPKRIAPKYFYDTAGSKLFERICELPEYYPTRTERGILEENASAIAALFPAGAALVEFGSGASTKTRILLRATPSVAAYLPVDISAEFLTHEAERLRGEFPRLEVAPVAADFSQPFSLPAEVSDRPKIGFFPGSTVGNFEPYQACAFLRHAARVLGHGALLLIGIDLVKSPQALHAAYNDAQGVTARFNLNLLSRINRELGGTFRLECFEHHAFYNREASRIEMHLASMKRQKVRVLGELFDFRRGETIHTENSYKFTVERFLAKAHGNGWAGRAVWQDADRQFAVVALQASDHVAAPPSAPD